MPGAGIANVRGVEEGKAEIGFANSISAVDALAGKAPFNKPHQNVCNVATLYPQYTQFVVLADAGINNVRGPQGQEHHDPAARQHRRADHASQLLEANGLSYNDVKVSFVGYTDSVNQMKDGHAVAFGLTTQIPAGAIMDLAAARDIKLLDQSACIDKMSKLQPGLQAHHHPEGHLSQAGQGRAGDRLLHAHRRLVQAAGGRWSTP